VIENYDEILETLRMTFRATCDDSAERLTATMKDQLFDRDEFINERSRGQWIWFLA
jgi:hypothetical protein